MKLLQNVEVNFFIHSIIGVYMISNIEIWKNNEEAISSITLE